MSYFKHDKAMVHEGAEVGEGTRIWANTNIQDGAKIGKNCNICDGAFVEKGAVIGNNVTVKHYVSVFDGVTIEDDVFVGSNIAFINDRYPRSNNGGNWTLEKVIVKKGASIGSNTVIMCGITVGEYAMVGAGSVVIKNVGKHELVAGNPAKVIGYVAKNGKKLDHDLVDSEGNQYKITDQGLEIL